MKKSDLLASLRENWWLIALLVLCVAGAMGALFRPKTPDPARMNTPEKPVVTDVAVRVQVSDEKRNEAAREQVRDDIKEYQARYDADPEGPDAPALLFAIGNLNMQKFQDYREAARCFELVVSMHSDWDGLYKVYPQLITCYQKLDDRKNLRWVCDEMMERYPEDSQEYQFAKSLKESS